MEFKKDWRLQTEAESHLLQRKLDAYESEKIKIDKRAENHRLFRRLQAERQEAEAEEKLDQARNAHELRRAQYEQETKLAKEMEHIHQEEMKEMKLRQRLRESSIELKTLEAQLRAAYVSKELAAQLAEKEAARMQEKLQSKQDTEYHRALWEKHNAEKTQKDLEEYHRKLDYRAELQDQIICAERIKQAAFEDFLREKKILDEVVRRIHEEDQRELEAKMLKMQKTKEEMDAFHQSREEWKKREQEEMEKENRRIEEYLEMQSLKKLEQMKDVLQREKQKAVITEKLSQQMYEIEEKKREEEAIVQQLLEEERKEALERRYQAELEKRLRQRIDDQNSYCIQMAERLKKLEQEAREENFYKQQLMEKFAENERLEQLTSEKRRQKIMEYRREVNSILEDRRQRRAEELQYLKRMHELEQEEENARKRLIEEERLRMLKEHATKLIGYLPRGVLRQDDLPHLGSEFEKKLTESGERLVNDNDITT